MGSIYLYPVWTRLWHLANAILFLLLIVSGLSMQYSSPGYPLIRFDIAVSMHNISGILLTVNYLVIIMGNFFTNNGKYYRIRWRRTKERIGKQFRYYAIGIFRGEKASFLVTEKMKFNPLQRVSYILVIYTLMFLVIVSGWALLFPEAIFIRKIFGTSGIHFTDLVHIVVGFILSLFMVVHIYFCTLTKPPLSSFRAILTGWHHE